MLASPSAAESKWVNQEIEHFVDRNGNADSVLIALTDGELHWDDDAADFAGSSLPPALIGRYGDQPLFVDLRWAKPRPRGRAERRRFRDSVASLAARIQGVNKEDLVGSDLSHRRRNRAMAAAAVVGLATLGIMAQTANTDAAERARREKAQQVAVLAAAEAPERLDRALLFGVASRAIADADDGRGLFNVLAQTGGIERFAYPSTPVRSAVPLPNGGFITGSVDGDVTIWDTDLRSRLGPIRVQGRSDSQHRDLEPARSSVRGLG